MGKAGVVWTRVERILQGMRDVLHFDEQPASCTIEDINQTALALKLVCEVVASMASKKGY